MSSSRRSFEDSSSEPNSLIESNLMGSTETMSSSIGFQVSRSIERSILSELLIFKCSPQCSQIFILGRKNCLKLSP